MDYYRINFFKGSISRFIARVKIGESKNYFLIKGVRDLEHGKNEVVCICIKSLLLCLIQKIGNALTSLKTSTCVPAIFGFPAESNKCETTIYYVVIPWIIGAIPLDSFIR